MLGDSPVMDAHVSVDIVVDQKNGTQITLPPVELFDRGGGDPDIVSGDGVYSRYLTSYASAGRCLSQLQVRLFGQPRSTHHEESCL